MHAITGELERELELALKLSRTRADGDVEASPYERALRAADLDDLVQKVRLHVSAHRQDHPVARRHVRDHRLRRGGANAKRPRRPERERVVRGRAGARSVSSTACRET